MKPFPPPDSDPPILDYTNKLAEIWLAGIVFVWSDVYQVWFPEVYQNSVSIKPGETGTEAYTRQYEKRLGLLRRIGVVDL